MIRLVTPSDLSSDAMERFMKHGCDVDVHETYVVVVLPAGTCREPIFPRTLLERFKIMLPDGYQMREVYDRFCERSFLFYE